MQQPAPLSRDERKKRQYDYLMDKAEYATDLFFAGINKEAALCCLRKMWDLFESMNEVPEHLEPVRDLLWPTIRQYGSNYATKGEPEDA